MCDKEHRDAKDTLLPIEVREVRGYIELLYAIQTIEYHNKNWLPDWAIQNPGKLNEEKRDLFERALTVLGSSSICQHT